MAIVLWLTMMFPLANTVFAKDITISFFSPRGADDIFWGQFTGFMEEAVKDLGMRLIVYHANGNHVKMVEQINHSIKNDRPSILVFQNFKKQGKLVLDMAEKARIPAFVVNAGFSDREGVGKPRENYKYWIGEMLPDDDGAGFMLASLLLANAPTSHDKRIQMVALTGNIADSASTERQKGLERFVRANPRVNLVQVFSTDWGAGMAKMKFKLIKTSRYPDTRIVWAAGDAISLGVVEAAKELGLVAGRDYVTGGIDWSEDGLKSVMSGEMTVSIGGHFMEGAWAAILIHDYFNGKDFSSETVQMRSRMSVITRGNANVYMRKLARDNWHQIDFKRFSKVFNPSVRYYNFNVQSVLSQIR